ncbi:glycosyltransferase family 4 protein [Marininema mesophilum]|nr:glycosyltransferase family 4 protein [Marininema mesophilum]
MSKQIRILTHSFLDAYNNRLDRVFGGGLERYIVDLCHVITRMGLAPEVHQLGYKQSFSVEMDGIPVHGYSCEEQDRTNVFQGMATGANAPVIYASFIWKPMQYRSDGLIISHGINWDHPLDNVENKKMIGKAIQGALDQVRTVVSVDTHFLSFTRTVCNLKYPDQMEFLPNFVDTRHFHPIRKKNNENGRVRILFPRRISWERGVIPMMVAVDDLLTNYPFLEVEFAGDFQEGELVHRAFSRWFSVHPHQDRLRKMTYNFHDVAKAYQEADIVVIPTIFSEGTSFSCLEALSTGKAIVASNVGGLNDLILQGYNGYLVNPHADEITDVLRFLVTDTEECKRLGKNARRTSLVFDRKRWMNKWEKILYRHFHNVGYTW